MEHNNDVKMTFCLFGPWRACLQLYIVNAKEWWETFELRDGST